MYITLLKSLLKLPKYRVFLHIAPRGCAICIYIWIPANYIAYTGQWICFHFNKYCGCQDYFFWLRARELIIQGKEKGSGKGEWHCFISHEASCLLCLLVFRRVGQIRWLSLVWKTASYRIPPDDPIMFLNEREWICSQLRASQWICELHE